MKFVRMIRNYIIGFFAEAEFKLRRNGHNRFADILGWRARRRVD